MPSTDNVPATTKQIIQDGISKYFLQKYGTRYWLVLVDNHFDNVFTLFIYSRFKRDQLTKSHEVITLSRNQMPKTELIKLIRKTSQLSLEFRDTRHLINVVEPIRFDPTHGHNF
ncbi:hypothetical protein [Latilactobacillus sakei]|uniref:hypothetical protein n=1 Tax=Latilactobacillus sakei TaxID=1599 RepID=UPI002030BFA3|nr:hypothetical protein [Latilactobacillus sakei]MCM1636265.1 hypothetical protein [Latilactobacillus sakei]